MVIEKDHGKSRSLIVISYDVLCLRFVMKLKW